jgi:PHD/YefM family antitoxin component YafN of YafNO toxin-antitoxin module
MSYIFLTEKDDAAYYMNDQEYESAMLTETA